MNETLKNLKTRRSIRSFLPKQVEQDLLDQVLEAGTYAPTGGGQQVPVIVAVQDPATVKQLSRMNAKVIGNDSDPFYGAPTVLVVLANRSRRTYLLDGASVMTTLVNAAHAAGLASCWIHRAKEMFESDEGKALLAKWGIEGDYEGIGNVVVGYPAGPAPEPAPRKANYIIRV
ncbi:MAG: nitroreductase family protein [Eubacteriales bacterium]